MNNNEFNMKEYIQQIIIPFLVGTINKNIISTVYDLDGKIILITNLHARLWGYRHHKEMVGKSLVELLETDKFPDTVKTLNQIRERVISEEKIITYINCFPYKNSIAMLICYHFPLFDPDGKVVATRILGEQASLFNHSVEVKQHFKPEENIYKDKKELAHQKIKLTNREQEILYLLTIGFSQHEAASYLGITRGTLSKIIGSKLCPQFDIFGSNTKLLIKKVIKSKYFNHIPKSLLKPRVIIIDNDFEFLVD